MTVSQVKTGYQLEKEIRFIQAVSNRISKDSGTKAAFKRALSGEQEHIRKIYEYVLPYVRNASEWEQQNILIPVACLLAYYPQPIREPDKQRNFGHSCHILVSKTKSGSDRRFKTLLDLSLTDINSPLASLVRQMKSEGVSIDYPKLIADLRQWEHPNQYVQDQWARAFWNASSS